MDPTMIAKPNKTKIDKYPLCKCGYELETRQEIEHGMCDGCAIDLYEEQQRRREQRYLESL